MRTEGAVWKVGGSSTRLFLAGETEPVTLRAVLPLPEMVPGLVAEVAVDRRWQFKGHAYASGRILSSRLDVATLGLVPLRVRAHGRWRPGPIGDDDELVGVSALARALLPRAPFADCEMEQVIPGYDDDPVPWNTDPASEAVNWTNDGDIERGLDILARAVVEDLRYLDGHAHLGSVVLRRGPGARERALRHYTIGAAIGRSFLPDGFQGCLRSAWVDNRPCLRCLHGLARCQGAIRDVAAARATLLELLRFDPEDRIGAEILIGDLDNGRHGTWMRD